MRHNTKQFASEVFGGSFGMAGREMSDLLTSAAERIRAWRADPVLFVRENFGVEPDEWQKDALRAFADPSKPRIALQACTGPGKSTVEAWCGWNFLSCYADKGEHPNGYALSITGDNLKDGLWKELAKWRDRSEFLTRAFEWQKERIFAREFPATWWLSARTWSKSADAEAQGRTLSGLHSPFIFYLIDESGEIPPSVGRSAEQGLSNCQVGKILQGGNPTSHDGMLYAAANAQSDKWHVIRVSGDPDDPKRSPRVDLDWAREQIQTWGRENFWVMAYILGKFPPGSINALLSPDEVSAAMQRTLAENVYSNVQRRLGIDVARFGDDRTVIFPRQGLRAFRPVVMRNARTTEIAGRIAAAKSKWGSEIEMIDNSGGWGGGVIDQCLLGQVYLLPIDSSAPAIDQRYFNRRSELHFLAAEWVKKGGQLPNMPEMVREACAAKYWFEGGKFRVEEKKQVKKLLGNSPDLWDAFIYTFALPDMPSSVESVIGGKGIANTAGKLAHDWDPFAEREGALAS